MFVLAEGAAPVVHPASADGVFSLLWLVIALPLPGAAILLIGGPGGRPTSGATCSAPRSPIASFVLSLAMFVALLGRDGDDRQVGQHLYNWFEVGDLNVGMDLLYDPLSALFLLLITGVGSLIHVYSIGYMEHDPRRRRLLRVPQPLRRRDADCWSSRPTTSALFLGWEGVGLASYLLIGFWQHKHSAAAAAKKAFVINRVGDMGLSLASCCSSSRSAPPTSPTISANAGQASEGTMTALGLLLLLAACGKSAQVPLQSWLLDAMEGPTPVSALIHAATMVTAGVYLIVRSNFVFDSRPTRADRGRGRRRGDAALGRDHRLREGRHQEGAGRLDDEPDRLHDAGRRARARRATRSRSSTCSPTASSRPTCSSVPARSCTAWTTTSTCATTARCARRCRSRS